MSCPIDAFIFDLDGTVYLGDAVARCRRGNRCCVRNGKRTLFVSNKPLEPRDAYARKLTPVGHPHFP